MAPHQNLTIADPSEKCKAGSPSLILAAFVVSLSLGIAQEGWAQFNEASVENSETDNEKPAVLTPPGLNEVAEDTPVGGEPAETDLPQVKINEDATDGRVVGKLVSVSDRTLTVMNDQERQQYVVVGEAKVLRNGEPARLEDLQAKDVVRITTGLEPGKALEVVAVSPPAKGDKEPNRELRQRRMAEERENDGAQQRRRDSDKQTQAARNGGGRMWVVMIDPNGQAAESGIRPGDMILVVDQQMVQSEEVLSQFNLSSGIFPLRSNRNGEVVIGPNRAGVGLLGPGGVVVPTGVSIDAGTVRPNSAGQGVPQSGVRQPTRPVTGSSPDAVPPRSGDRSRQAPSSGAQAPPPAPPQSAAPQRPQNR